MYYTSGQQLLEIKVIKVGGLCVYFHFNSFSFLTILVSCTWFELLALIDQSSCQSNRNQSEVWVSTDETVTQPVIKLLTGWHRQPSDSYMRQCCEAAQADDEIGTQREERGTLCSSPTLGKEKQITCDLIAVEGKGASLNFI